MKVEKAYKMLDGLFSFSNDIMDNQIQATAKNLIYELRDFICDLHDKKLQSDNEISILKNDVLNLKTKNNMLQAALNGIIEGLERECD